jgi:citrate lyase subunit beta/citryl-CoA lyase
VTPLRSALFGPGSRPEILAKLTRSAPDAIILDLEDAVPSHTKESARVAVAAAIPPLRALNPVLPIYVRVNSITTGWFADDIECVTDHLTGIVLPKVQTPETIGVARSAIEERAGILVNVIAGLETVLGVVNAARIAASDGVIGCYFGAEDYVLDLGGMRTREGLEVLWARTQVAVSCRLAGIAAFDQVVTDFSSPEPFAHDASVGRSLGFSGKLCIHPSQVALAHSAFSATAAEVDRALRLLNAYAKARTRGEGAINFEGQMVDEPLARQAQRIIDSI